MSFWGDFQGLIWETRQSEIKKIGEMSFMDDSNIPIQFQAERKLKGNENSKHCFPSLHLEREFNFQ